MIGKLLIICVITSINFIIIITFTYINLDQVAYKWFDYFSYSCFFGVFIVRCFNIYLYET